MGDEIIRAFLQKIEEEPDDQMHRLVLADWLDEHDQPHRAELVRLHIELDRLDSEDPRRPALARREEEIRTEQRSALLGSLDQLPGTWQIEIGAYGQLNATVKVEQLGWLHLETPQWIWLSHLCLHGRMNIAAILESLESPNLASLTHLELFNNGLGDAGARLLAQSPLLSRLTRLTVRCNEIGSQGLADLAGSPHLTRLPYLDLSSNNIGTEGVQALAGSARMGRLRSLSLAFNSFGDGGALALASSRYLKCLEELVLGSISHFAPKTVEALRRRFGAGLDRGGRS